MEPLSALQLYDFDLPNPTSRISLFLPYHLTIHIGQLGIIKLGRFSLSLLTKIRIMAALEASYDLQAGSFCESASDAKILLGGEHRNDSIFNYTCGLYGEYYRSFLSHDAHRNMLKPVKGIILGDNVLLSQDSLVLDGSKLDDGCVIAAGAVVSNHCGKYGIYGGVPAKLIKSRFDSNMIDTYRRLDISNICAHSLPFLYDNMLELNNNSPKCDDILNLIDHMIKKPEIILSGSVDGKGGIKVHDIIEYRISGEKVDNAAALQTLNTYFGQIKNDRISTIKWSPDIFYAVGLTR